MKISVTLELKTREAHQLFTRKIKGDRLFIHALLYKLNKVASFCPKTTTDIEQYGYIEMTLINLRKQFESENQELNRVLQGKDFLKGRTISVKPQFCQKVEVENPLAVALIQVFASFDELLATIELLHLAGSFKSSIETYALIDQKKKTLNQFLCKLLYLSNCSATTSYEDSFT